MARTTLSSLQLFLCMQSHAPSNTAAHFSACKLRLSRSIIIKSYALANLINGISLAAIQIHGYTRSWSNHLSNYNRSSGAC